MSKSLSMCRIIFGVAFLMLSTSGSLWSQEPTFEGKDVLYLKNGSIFKGKLIHYWPGDSLTFAINGTSSSFTYRNSFIKKIKMYTGASVYDSYQFKTISGIPEVRFQCYTADHQKATLLARV
ncbi:MAG: hypothetical protein IPP49_16270 [Saprospiraceae bacterium]|nr:hypothetical protein [Saprospiraceae bacterium]